jgi:hypothetical protein
MYTLTCILTACGLLLRRSAACDQIDLERGRRGGDEERYGVERCTAKMSEEAKRRPQGWIVLGKDEHDLSVGRDKISFWCALGHFRPRA